MVYLFISLKHGKSALLPASDVEKYQLNANDSLQKSEAGLNRFESAPVQVTFKTSAQLSSFNAPSM